MHEHAPAGTETAQHVKLIAKAFAITLAFMLVEFAGGLLTGSLALLSDALHMFSDAAALGLSLFAAGLSLKKGDTVKTYGYQRVQVIFALFNGLALWVIAGIIFHEAVIRLKNPVEIKTIPMMVIAIAGLISNMACAYILNKGRTGNINIRSAFLHVLTDALGSVGVILASIIMLATGSFLADPVISFVIVILTVYSSWHLIKDTWHILMEGAPADINIEEIKKRLLSIEGVYEVHDLHLWSITTGFHPASVHLRIKENYDQAAILQAAQDILKREFGLWHCTIQIENHKYCCGNGHTNCCG